MHNNLSVTVWLDTVGGEGSKRKNKIAAIVAEQNGRETGALCGGK